MNHVPRFKKTILCVLIGTLVAPPFALAAPITLVDMPAGQNERTPAPNVIVTVDD